jgi:hypothetical protein
MAISKPKNSKLLDDLVLNFDPFVVNGLDELNPSSSTDQSTSAVQDDAGAAQAPGARIELPVAEAAAEEDGPPTVAGPLLPLPLPGPQDPGPQDPPPQVADPDFNGIPAQAPDPGPQPTVQENASQIGEVDPALGVPMLPPGVQPEEPAAGPEEPAAGPGEPHAGPGEPHAGPEEPDGVPMLPPEALVAHGHDPAAPDSDSMSPVDWWLA